MSSAGSTARGLSGIEEVTIGGEWSKPIFPRVCRICGKEFLGRRSQKYCGPECKLIAKRRTQAEFKKRKNTRGAEPVKVAKYDPIGPDILKSAEHKEWSRRYRRVPKDLKKFDRTLAECREKGMTYAEKQRAESIKLFATLEV